MEEPCAAETERVDPDSDLDETKHQQGGGGDGMGDKNCFSHEATKGTTVLRRQTEQNPL